MTVHLLDLTGAQIASIERAVDQPVNNWRAAHKGKLYPLIMAAALGGKPEEYAAMTLRELLDAVDLKDDSGKQESAPRSPDSPAL